MSQNKGRILRPKQKLIIIDEFGWYRTMNKGSKLSKAGSGCVIKGVKYKWRLHIPFNGRKTLSLSGCQGKYYSSGWGDILFTHRRDAEYFFLRSF